MRGCTCHRPLRERVYRVRGPRYWSCKKCELLIEKRAKPAPPPPLDEDRVYAIVRELVEDRPTMSSTEIRTEVSRAHGAVLISNQRYLGVISKVRDELGVVTTQGKVWA